MEPVEFFNYLNLYFYHLHFLGFYLLDFYAFLFYKRRINGYVDK